jgi:signal transduction histidine kinase
MVESVIDEMSLTTNKKIILKGKTGKTIKGDFERLSQVVNNILSNAIKYSPKSREVIVSLSATKKNITISIKDFGIGIEKQDQEKIFEKFYRVTGPDEKTYPGMGIGLYLCREIINNHKGEIKVESEKGKGSNFIIKLPLSDPN